MFWRLIRTLDKQVERVALYWTDSKKYMELLDVIKGMGFKVYRNPKGKHRVQMDMSNAFGGIFKDFFSVDIAAFREIIFCDLILDMISGRMTRFLDRLSPRI